MSEVAHRRKIKGGFVIASLGRPLLLPNPLGLNWVSSTFQYKNV